MEELIEDEIKFYSRFTKPLILNLPNWKDRVLAATWVKKIRDESAGTENLRVVYLKLLLFSLQRQRLVGIFADDPGKYEELEAIPEGFDINDVAKNLLEVEFAERQDRIRRQLRGQVGIFPPYLTDCSSDFREYVAVQNIPGFGVHGYYAVSKEPVNKWYRSERGIFPKLARSAFDTTTPAIPDTSGVETTAASGDPLCLCVDDQEKADPDCKCKGTKRTPSPKRKRNRKYGNTAPVSPMGGAFFTHEERTPPTWGSNLSQVKDIPGAAESDDSLDKAAAEGFGLTEALSGVEQFVDEYKKGRLDKVSKIKGKRIVVPTDKPSKGNLEEEADEEAGEVAGEEEEEEDLDASRRLDDIKADAHIINYYRGLLSQTATKQSIAKVSENVVTSSPARTGIPLTTPKLSASPRRPLSPERLYAEESAAGATQDMPLPVPAAVAGPSTAVDDEADELEAVNVTDDEFTIWTKRLKSVERICEKSLRQLDASQQVDKTISLGRKGVAKQDQSCGPGKCGRPCE